MRISLLIVWIVTVVITVGATFLTSLYFFERPQFGERVEQKSMTSSILGEEREYLVHLPEGYEHEATQSYAVLYVLDGSSQDLHTAASADLMARIGITPKVIIVGIPNVSGTGRQRDYTPPGMRQDIDFEDSPEGRADNFMAFFRDELIPKIDAEYRTTSTRMLAGNSRGGLFVLYALTSDYLLFDSYFAHSPAFWRDDAKIVTQL